MWIADRWKDYEVLDCSGGEKLERWGDFLLIRPDPQVIWETPKENRGWRRPNGHYHRSAKGGGEWEFFDLPQQWTIGYHGLTFNLKPFSFKHTGLFPEQAANWDWFGEKIKNAGRPYKKPFSPRDAVEMIMSMTEELDINVMRCFLESVILYPVGTDVALSNGETARVVENIPNAVLRPKVLGLTTGRVYDLANDVKCANIIIL